MSMTCHYNLCKYFPLFSCFICKNKKMSKRLAFSRKKTIFAVLTESFFINYDDINSKFYL